ncbi:MAG: signal recognition particle protein [Candidatus Marinimicrobia bacterium]|jgi:signal recognition particle subunit SRP54|nr:signal recognition particle protein [Candidatus Neomarinimicrobiota bacterium]
MLEQLKENLEGIFKDLRGQGKITEKNIDDTLREVRRTLLEADVNFSVAKEFISRVKERALGVTVIKSISPGQQIIKIFHSELIKLLGKENVPLKLDGLPPSVIMVVGLQGSGKTTFVAKLAKHLRDKGKNPMMVAADIYRPAAIEQLEKLGKQISMPVYSKSKKNPVKICKNAIKSSRNDKTDVVILDTAGRLHIDEEMMKELQKINKEVEPNEILFVADGMIGQDAVNAADKFDSMLPISGIVLTKIDGDAKGGAAISIREVTNKPIKFVSVGEKISDLEKFYPERFAGRILGKGDIVSFVEKAQKTIDDKEAEKLEKKIRKNEFDLLDFQKQLKMIRKLGSLSSLMEMIPGASKFKNAQVDEKRVDNIAAIMNSMTIKEKETPNIIDANRKKRIARGSGLGVVDVNRLLNQFKQMKKMMKKMNKMGFSKKGFDQIPLRKQF